METYSVSAECGNCGEKCSVDVPKGTPISAASNLCPNCGCNTLRLQKKSQPKNPWDKYKSYPIVEPWIKKISEDELGPYRVSMECTL